MKVMLTGGRRRRLSGVSRGEKGLFCWFAEFYEQTPHSWRNEREKKNHEYTI